MADGELPASLCALGVQGERLMAFGGEREGGGGGERSEVSSDAAVLDTEAALWVPLPMSGAAPGQCYDSAFLSRSTKRIDSVCGPALHT